MTKAKSEEKREIPDYYNLDPEPVKAILSWGLDYALGNVIKYVVRAGHKPNESAISDLKKAMNYLRVEIEILESKRVS